MPRNPNCNCEDFPCCGCGTEPSQEEQEERFMEQVQEQDRELSGVKDLDSDEDQESDDEPWDGFRSDAEADQDALNSVYGYDPEDCDTPMGDYFGGE